MINTGPPTWIFLFFFFNDTATTEIYTLSLHDALPISRGSPARPAEARQGGLPRPSLHGRSEEHTSELQSHLNLVCRLLLEKKKANPLRASPFATTAHPPRAHTSTSTGPKGSAAVCRQS